jgi:hypothetical protein
MDMPLLTEDFNAFLKLLAAHGVDYLLVGGYAVGVHGYPRATADLDIRVATRPDNADRIVTALAAFGFAVDALAPGLVLASDSLVRLGQPPFRIELMTSIDGVDFDGCWQRRVPRGHRWPAGPCHRARGPSDQQASLRPPQGSGRPRRAA